LQLYWHLFKLPGFDSASKHKEESRHRDEK
jgi:hypothetical protein